MDGTLFDFQSGIDKLSGEDHEIFHGHYDDCPWHFRTHKYQNPKLNCTPAC